MLGHAEVCITSYAYKGVFSIGEGREDTALSKAETGKVEQCQNNLFEVEGSV